MRRAPLPFALLAAGTLLAACAPQPPVTMPDTYSARRAEVIAPPAKIVCTVGVVEITDARASPEVLGVVAGRALYAPKDSAAWLRSIMATLNTRGVAPTFDGAAAPVQLKVRLLTAWVTSVSTNKGANVVMHASIAREGAPPLERDYRGAVTRSNWSSTANELQNVINDAFAVALDQMSVDLKKACGAQLQIPREKRM